MMDVAFWSNSHGSGVTSFTAVAGIICAQIFDRRVILLDNHFSKSPIADILSENRWNTLSLDEKFYLETGQGMRARFISRRVGKKLIGSDILEILEDRLWLNCREPWGGELQCEHCASYRPRSGPTIAVPDHELCFVDTECRDNITTKEVLDKADMVVVVMPDKESEIEDLFQNYKSLIKKSIFILNKNISVDHVDPDLICKRFGISESSLITLPYDEAFETAAIFGRMPEYVIANIGRDASKLESGFAGALVRLVMKLAGDNKAAQCGKGAVT